MMNILEIKNIVHAYNEDIPTFKDFSFSLKKGEIVSIIGASGIGKTTLLRIIAGLEGLKDGEILEANQIICYFNYVNRTINGLGVSTTGDKVGYYS